MAMEMKYIPVLDTNIKCPDCGKAVRKGKDNTVLLITVEYENKIAGFKCTFCRGRIDPSQVKIDSKELSLSVLKKIVKAVYQNSREDFVKENNLTPLFVAYTAKGIIASYITWNSLDQKRIAFNKAIETTKNSEPFAVVFVSTAWFKEFKKSDSASIRKAFKKGVRNDVDRKECLIAYGTDVVGNHYNLKVNIHDGIILEKTEEESTEVVGWLDYIFGRGGYSSDNKNVK